MKRKKLNRLMNEDVVHEAEPDEHILRYYYTCKMGAESLGFMCTCESK